LRWTELEGNMRGIYFDLVLLIAAVSMIVSILVVKLVH
jgi:hypothetical protein